jgi:hypothetical protein
MKRGGGKSRDSAVRGPPPPYWIEILVLPRPSLCTSENRTAALDPS